MTALSTRPPREGVAWPLILVEGEEHAGQRSAIAELSASDRIGRTVWLAISSGTPDEYSAVPGARFEVVVHDGRWSSILGQVRAAAVEARATVYAGEPPMVLVVDSATTEWDMHKDWADAKARRRDKASGLLTQNPDAQVEVTSDLWSLANARHRELMNELRTFPGIVVLAANGYEVAAVDRSGNPTADRTWRVDAQKKVPAEASVWVRFTRTDPPRIIGNERTPYVGVQPGPVPDFTLEALIFDMLGVDLSTVYERELQLPPTLAEIAARARGADTRAEVNEVYQIAKELDLYDVEHDGQTIRTMVEQKAQMVAEREAQDAAAEGGGS